MSYADERDKAWEIHEYKYHKLCDKAGCCRGNLYSWGADWSRDYHIKVIKELREALGMVDAVGITEPYNKIVKQALEKSKQYE